MTRRPIHATLACAVLTLASFSAPHAGPGTLVVCAPGYPSDTEQAQPTMDAFATGAAEQARWPPGSLSAVYHSTAEGGIERMRSEDAALALVPLAFYLQFGEELKLRPRLRAVPEAAAEEVWLLVAGKGRLSRAAGLEGWELTSRAGYAPDFIRKSVLGGWGRVPDSAEITATARALSALRRAARGENVAVLLDGEQGAAFDRLPPSLGDQLEIVYRSPPQPSSLLCAIEERLDAGRGQALFDSLLRMHDHPAGRELLKEMRLSHFQPLDEAALDRIRETVRR